MNHKQATVKFSLNIHSSNAGEVWPLSARDNPKMDDRIRETYYAGKSVHMSIGVTVEAPEFQTQAVLGEEWQRGTSASFRAVETDDLSPASAASKMIAIAHALSRWEKNRQKNQA